MRKLSPWNWPLGKMAFSSASMWLKINDSLVRFRLWKSRKEKRGWDLVFNTFISWNNSFKREEYWHFMCWLKWFKVSFYNSRVFKQSRCCPLYATWDPFINSDGVKERLCYKLLKTDTLRHLQIERHCLVFEVITYRSSSDISGVLSFFHVLKEAHTMGGIQFQSEMQNASFKNATRHTVGYFKYICPCKTKTF